MNRNGPLEEPIINPDFISAVRSVYTTPAGSLVFNGMHYYREALKEFTVARSRSALTPEQRANLDGQCQVIELILAALQTEGNRDGSNSAATD